MREVGPAPLCGGPALPKGMLTRCRLEELVVDGLSRVNSKREGGWTAGGSAPQGLDYIARGNAPGVLTHEIPG